MLYAQALSGNRVIPKGYKVMGNKKAPHQMWGLVYGNPD